MERVAHVFGPVWDRHSRVLILGTMPSPRSREAGFYYGHPRNRFWQILAAVLGQDVPTGAEARRTFLLNNKIALFDVLQSCDITGAADSTIIDPIPNDFSGILAGSDICAVFTTGRKATALYCRLCFPATGIPARYLPSPSPANCACGMEELISSYGEITEFLH